MKAFMQQVQKNPEPIAASQEDLKAITSENRREILRALKQRRKTLSEISKMLDIKPSSAKQHMQILEASGFIRIIDEGRKWKYYELTGKGTNLFSFSERNISVLLVFASSLIALVVALSMLYSVVPQYSTVISYTNTSFAADKTLEGDLITAGSQNADAATRMESAENPSAVKEPVNISLIVLSIVVVIGASFSLGYCFFSLRRRTI